LLRPHDKKQLLIGAGIFALALVVRLVYLRESLFNPAFANPVLDSGIYDNLARSLAAGESMSGQFFWQPFFYPVFLSIVYWLSNGSIIFGKVVQIFLGSLTCLLTYQLGKRVFNQGAGIIAGLITALYGPLIFFDGELLATGWAALWTVSLVLLFLISPSKRSALFFMVLGICGGLSIITRPTFVPFFIAGLIWLAICSYRSSRSVREALIRLSMVLLGFLAIAVPVGAKNLRLTGHFGILPSSGGLNLYIGNNPDYTQTMAARPGWPWQEIVELPERNGVTSSMWARQKFFLRKVKDYIVTEPLSFVKGLIYKTSQFFSSREMPRNVDVYLFGKWSLLLRLLTFKAGPFGFPFGILLPLTVLGLVKYFKRIPAPLLLFLIFYPLSVILVFPSARYRAPVVPAMSVIAAAGVLEVVRSIRYRKVRSIFVISVIFLGVTLLSSLPGLFPAEKANYEAELYYAAAGTLKRRNQPDEAVTYYQKALELDMSYTEAHYNLANTYAAMGKLDQAIDHYKEALDLMPESAMIHGNLAFYLVRQGRPEQAVKHYKEALRIKPDSPRIAYELGRTYAQLERFDLAIENLNKAIQLEPDYAQVYYSLAQIYRQQGKFDLAKEHLEEAIRLQSKPSSQLRDKTEIIEY
jgi:Tfp pilus assembly protein PilF